MEILSIITIIFDPDSITWVILRAIHHLLLHISKGIVNLMCERYEGGMVKNPCKGRRARFSYLLS